MCAKVIRIESVSKRYFIGNQRHDTLRDSLVHGMKGLWKRISRNDEMSANIEEFWALRDISLDVDQGDVVGIVGRNGAGKSTLLKILSRITEPTTGSVRLRGRVASLLEVGTGFHPELTGRDNIFLNGAILGMRQSEIRAKFDEIVAFSEIQRFLDTPVKRYSSGMYVRLAFAVAAHLDPEILIIDEVLAVGDVAFQQKCIGKVKDVSRSAGRTVLFVSHNLAAVRQLCTSAILLDKGSLVAKGNTSSILSAYVDSLTQNKNSETLPTFASEVLERAFPTGLWIETAGGKPLGVARVGEPWVVRIRIKAARRIERFVLGVGMVTSEGIGVQTCWTKEGDLLPGEYEYVFEQDRVALAADSYRVVVGLSECGKAIVQFSGHRLEISGENPLIDCVASSGAGLVLNSMSIRVRPL